MSQKSRIEQQLRENGKVSRNWCLKRFISRLSAIMLTLKQEGWDFIAYKDDGDYIYKLINTPPNEKKTYGSTAQEEAGQTSLFTR